MCERERNKTREIDVCRGKGEDSENFLYTHICDADPLILSHYPPVKRQEFIVGVPSAKFQALIADQRMNE